jgi:hypothetical protein
VLVSHPTIHARDIVPNKVSLHVSPPLLAPELFVRRSGNPLEETCTGFSFTAPPQPDERTFGINEPNIFASGYRYGIIPKEWKYSDRTPGNDTEVSFSSQFRIAAWGASPGPDDVNSFLNAVLGGAGEVWTLLTNGGSNATPGVEAPVSGTLSGSGTTGGSRQLARDAGRATVFTIHQHVRAGASAPLKLKLTSYARAILAGQATAGPIRTTLTFTPDHGRRVTMRGTFTPQVLPAISSVQFRGGAADPTIVVHGRGLAPLPKPDPAGSPVGHDGCPAESGNYGKDYGTQFGLYNLSKNWSAGVAVPANTSCIGIIPTKVTAGEVDFRFGSFYTHFYPQFSLRPGDHVQVILNGGARNVNVNYAPAAAS